MKVCFVKIHRVLNHDLRFRRYSERKSVYVLKTKPMDRSTPLLLHHFLLDPTLRSSNVVNNRFVEEVRNM